MLERRHDSRRARIFHAILVLPLTGLLISADPYAADRERMVREQIESRGIRGAELLRVLRATPRHLFVPVANRPMAYDDHPVPIGFEATISQPYIVALMTDLLAPRKTDRVLEIGPGRATRQRYSRNWRNRCTRLRLFRSWRNRRSAS